MQSVPSLRQGAVWAAPPDVMCGSRSTSYVTVQRTHSRCNRADECSFRALELLLGFYPDGKGELPSRHTKSIRGNPCMTSRFVDKGIEQDRRMTSSDVIGPGTKCWRAQASQSGNISTSTGARAVSSIWKYDGSWEKQGKLGVPCSAETRFQCFASRFGGGGALIREPGFSSCRCL